MKKVMSNPKRIMWKMTEKDQATKRGERDQCHFSAMQTAKREEN